MICPLTALLRKPILYYRHCLASIRSLQSNRNELSQYSSAGPLASNSSVPVPARYLTNLRSIAVDTNWARIWLDFRITIVFLISTISVGLTFVLIQNVGSRSTSFLWALAALATGGLIGFLFGIPRVLQDNNSVPAVRDAGDDETEPLFPRPVYRMQVNTNLEQISDWLTKIIVGFGLIQLRNIPDYLNRLSLFIASGLGPTPQTQVLAIALVVYFFVIGFLSGYLMTRIYLAQAFSRADWGAQNTIVVGGSTLTLTEVSEQSRALLADLQDQILNIQKAVPAAAPPKSPEDVVRRSAASNVSSIMWVDDNPKNNSFLVERLTKRGIQVAQVLSTSEALSLMKTRSFDRVISDMGRLESAGYNSSAGLDLLRAMRDGGNETPIAFFCSRRAVSLYGLEAMALGAKTATSSATELLQAIEVEL